VVDRERMSPGHWRASVLCISFSALRLLVVFLLLFWHAPLGVHNTTRRYQPPQRTVLSHIDCFIQCEVVGSRPDETRESRVSLDGVQPRDTRSPWWIFFFRNELSRLEHDLFLKVSFVSCFRKRLSKENFLVCH